MTKHSFIYIMTNSSQTTLYIGVTNNLARRVYEHKHKLVEGFTKRYNLTKLVYFEMFESITQAIEREKQLKAGSRKKKVDLINTLNENWNDLYDSILEWQLNYPPSLRTQWSNPPTCGVFADCHAFSSQWRNLVAVIASATKQSV